MSAPVFFELNPRGDLGNRELAFVGERPRQLGHFGYRLAQGEKTSDLGLGDIRLDLSAARPGLELSTLLGNSIGYLILATAAKDLLAQHEVSPTELHQVALHDHKSRPFSRDYWIVNPLRFVDCLDREASRIQYSQSTPGAIVWIHERVFAARALAGAPDLFRLPEEPMAYFVSERLAQRFEAERFTNVRLTAVRTNG
jgi:hypothetical protein